ncbi:PAS domain S-box protein [Aliifodinibius sp. S!AR15-10]|uniref:PAS domain-containing sensor histidine kinase n=1 Tax=Aliifodinibius sp. S!AR15-10 TaxID=2950437 RepID=UPI0028635D71|nr:PAS domain S-box protein [Aliifodinibius sp. S!AR15-10]MDR8392386.1 PAS domain S-box protein [Aliifodinibius sp. S!AR15-10]
MLEEKTYHILLVAHETGNSRPIAEEINDSQLQSTIIKAKGLKGGIEHLQNREFDIILFDLSQEEAPLTSIQKINKRSQRAPVIAIIDDEKKVNDTIHSEAEDVLLKKDLTPLLLEKSITYAIKTNKLVNRLEKSEEHLLEAKDLAHLGNFEQDLETGKISWSDETFRIFEMDPSEGAPHYQELREMMHLDYRDKADQVVEQVRNTGEKAFLEFRVTTAKGNPKYLYSILNPTKDREGNVTKIFGTTHDITQQKKTEEELKENEHRYRMLFQSATDEILVFQIDSNARPLPFMEVNSVACNMLNYSREELLQKTIYDIVVADHKEMNSRIERVLQENESVHESRHVTKEGHIIPLEIRARAFKYKGRTTFISIGRDIRERRKLEQKILSISEEERQRVGRDMHDSLGQMLTGIGLISQSLAKKLKAKDLPGAEEAQEITDMIKEADAQAHSLTRGLIPVKVESNGLDAALQQLTDYTSNLYDIEISYSNAKKNLPQDNTSAVNLYRIAQEAITNAVKHGKATSIHVALDSTDTHAILRITDNGIGFANAETNKDGMGVRIMHFRAHMIGGSLEINKKKEKGAEIICQVPLDNNYSMP